MASLLDSIFSVRVLKAGVEYAQRKTIEFIGDGITIADDPVNERTKITLVAGTAAPHAPTHVWGGSDVIDGARLSVSYAPANYTRELVPGESDDLAQLTSNLRGIDNQFSTFLQSLQTLRRVTYVSENGTSHTFVLGDAYTTILYGSNAGVAIAMPSNATLGFEVGTVIVHIPMGTGQLTFSAGAGATLVSGGNELKSLRQYGPVVTQKTGTNAWLMSGEKAA